MMSRIVEMPRGGAMTMDVHSLPHSVSLGILLYRLRNLGFASMRRAFQEAGYRHLTPEQWGLLVRLRRQEGVNQSQLAEKTFKDRHNIARILFLLEKHGYIERQPDEGDMRAYRLFLTDAGRAVLDTTAPVVENHFSVMFKGLGTSDLKALNKLVERIMSNLGLRS